MSVVVCVVFVLTGHPQSVCMLKKCKMDAFVLLFPVSVCKNLLHVEAVLVFYTMSDIASHSKCIHRMVIYYWAS